jgi:nucleoside phosphorylase
MGESCVLGAPGPPPLADLCVVTAVDVEFNIAAKLLSDRSVTEMGRMKICRGRFGGRRVTVLQSQIGADGFADRLSGHLADNRHDALIVAGLAGGLDPELRAGDTVIYDCCYDARALNGNQASAPSPGESGRVAGDEALSNRLFEALLAADVSCVRGAGVTVNRIVTESKDKVALIAGYGAAAVDMETYEVIRVCERFGMPAAAFRVISDEAGRDLPDFNRAYEADGRMIRRRMAAAMFARPAASLRFLLGLWRALPSLRESLLALLKT